jgi:hypothetical protein
VTIQHECIQVADRCALGQIGIAVGRDVVGWVIIIDDFDALV